MIYLGSEEKEFQLRYEFEKTVKVVRKEMGTVGEIERIRDLSHEAKETFKK